MNNIGLVGESVEFQNILNASSIIAVTDATALILGESGTGKELIAQNLHFKSNRAQKPFITVNCASLPENLVESELFGHKKGAFTGADSHRDGRVKAANHGTLFLDEIGELPLAIQAKFLRFLESGECQPLGEERTEKLNVRIIAATNRDLLQEVKAGNFREDLFYRLNIVPIKLPTLKERANDIPLLLAHYAKVSAKKHSLQPISFKKDALSFLKQYAWPGNIRELKNFVERMAIFFAGMEVELSQIPTEMRYASEDAKSDTVFQLPDQGIKLESFEIDLINQALQKTSGNRSRAARLLGLTRDTLLYRMKKHAIA